MREIKFRAWHREKKCWLDSVRIHCDGSWSGSIVEERGEVDGYDERECELMQYTGLKDKNGTEIYEGDIVDYYGQHVQVIFMDRYGAFGLCGLESWDCGYLPQMLNVMEVIGNIYENPELLQ